MTARETRPAPKAVQVSCFVCNHHSLAGEIACPYKWCLLWAVFQALEHGAGLVPDSTMRSLRLRHCWETLKHGGLLSRQRRPTMALACRGSDLRVPVACMQCYKSPSTGVCCC